MLSKFKLAQREWETFKSNKKHNIYSPFNSVNYKFITCISKTPTATEYFVQNKVQSHQWYFGKISQELKVHCQQWSDVCIFLIKPSSFALVNMANLHDQLKTIVQSVGKYIAFTLNSRLHEFLLKWLDLPVKICWTSNVTAPQKGNKKSREFKFQT